MFHNIGLFWIIQSNKNPHFVFQKHRPSSILNVPCYNTMICSLWHDMVFEDYCTTTKSDKYNLMCSIKAHVKTRNKSTITNLLMIRQEVVVADHFQPNSTEETLK